MMMPHVAWGKGCRCTKNNIWIAYDRINIRYNDTEVMTGSAADVIGDAREMQSRTQTGQGRACKARLGAGIMLSISLASYKS